MGIRTAEPASGAFISVALVLVLAAFTPYTYIQFDLRKLLIGGAIAYVLALGGARLGERVTTNG